MSAHAPNESSDTNSDHPSRSLSLYTDLAALWHLLSPPDDYQPEADEIRAIVDALLPADPNAQRRLIEFGAGGGHTLFHLRNHFDVQAVDLSAQMLKQCQLLNPTITCHEADMRTARLGQRFDAVLIHDSIDYMLTAEDAQAAITTAYEHTKPGGIAFFAPTYIADEFEDNETSGDANRDEQQEVAYVSRVYRPNRNENQYTLEMTIIHRRAGQINVVTDEHHCGLFPRALWEDWIEAAGFGLISFEHEDPDAVVPWHLFVGIKRD